MEEPFRIIVVDDHQPLLGVLSELLEGRSGLTVVGEAGDALTAIELLNEQSADVVVMDVLMPRMGGIEATRAIRRFWPHIPVVGLSVRSPSAPEYQQMLDAGAECVLSKLQGDDAIAAEIFRVARSRSGLVQSPT